MPDLNKMRPAVTIMLDKERHLKLDLNAMASFEEATGKNLFDEKVVQSLTRDIKPSDLRALLWACLIHEDNNLTIKQVGALITFDNMQDIAGKIIRAWGNAMPEVDKGKDPLAEKPAQQVQ